MNKKAFYILDVEITIREIYVSVIIVLILLSLGWFISNKIRQGNQDKKAELESYLKVVNKDIYDHTINTKLGNIIAYGTMNAVNPVSNESLSGQYSYIREDEEHYVQKTRTVSYSCHCNSKGQCKTCYKTETYWEWDRVNTKTIESDKMSFFENEYNFNQFYNYPTNYIDTIKTSSDVRFVYYATPQSFDTSIIANTSEGIIKSQNNDNRIGLYPYKTPEEVIEFETSFNIFWLVMFWILWLCLIAGVAYGFVYLENNFLED